MKKIFLFTLLITLIFSASVRNCEAKDVWVSYWASKNIDVYVIEDTVVNTSSGDYASFTVSTKRVRDGELLKFVNWEFLKYKNDMWRYETNTMDGRHTTVVIPKNGVFEFCMQKLGLSYQIRGNYYY